MGENERKARPLIGFEMAQSQFTSAVTWRAVKECIYPWKNLVAYEWEEKSSLFLSIQESHLCMLLCTKVDFLGDILDLIWRRTYLRKVKSNIKIISFNNKGVGVF